MTDSSMPQHGDAAQIRQVRLHHRGGQVTLAYMFDAGAVPPEDVRKVEINGRDYFRKPHDPDCADPDCPVPRGVDEVWVNAELADSMARMEEEE